jgi:hypothetical protein
MNRRAALMGGVFCALASPSMASFATVDPKAADDKSIIELEIGLEASALGFPVMQRPLRTRIVDGVSEEITVQHDDDPKTYRFVVRPMRESIERLPDQVRGMSDPIAVSIRVDVSDGSGGSWKVLVDTLEMLVQGRSKNMVTGWGMAMFVKAQTMSTNEVSEARASGQLPR